MKKLVTTSVLVLALALMAVAAGIDGKYSFEQTMRMGKKGGEGAEGRKATVTLDLKSEGARLTGTVTTAMGERERTADIKDGKIEGDKFSFTTVQQSPRGEMKVIWEGTVKGDELSGTRKMEGFDREMPFTAKKK